MGIIGGGKTYSYEYDVNGLRTRKTNSDGGYTEYFIMDGLTVAERRFDSTNTEVYVMRYYFDESNAPIGIGIQYPSSADTYWENYYFAKNLQGDIIAIYNSNNGNPNLIATYEYDAWGKPLGIYNASGTAISQTGNTIAAINPFRYRGYRYDADTGFYYLQSRYYDPVIGRFINADALADTNTGFLGYNMFAYCNNNPVNYNDPTGYAIGWTNQVVINDGARTQETSWINKIGNGATVNVDHIQIDLEENLEAIEELMRTMSVAEMSDRVAEIICARYEKSFEKPFILSDSCVSGEIRDHIDAYLWAIGKKKTPNLIAVGFMFVKSGYDAKSVEEATVKTDIRTADVVAGGGITSQASIFGYRDGIRDCYIGTDIDPWKSSRKNR